MSGDELIGHAPPLAAPTGEPRGALPAAPPVPLSAEDEARVRELWSHARADATMRAYRSDWAIWEAWARSSGYPSAPAAAQHVVAWISKLAEDGKRPSTIARRLAAIGWVHGQLGFVSPTRDPRVQTALSAARRKLGTKPKRKRAIDRDLLRRMLGTLPKSKGGARDRALLLVGLFGAFRRSEFVALRLRDLEWKKEGVIIHLGKTKADQEGKGESVPIAAAKDTEMCAVTALREWIRIAGITDEAAFVFPGLRLDGTFRPEHIDAQTVCRLVKRCIKALGLDPAPYGAHSLRAGFVTQGFRDGASIPEIQAVTRHTDPRTLLRYCREDDPFTGSAAKRVADGGAPKTLPSLPQWTLQIVAFFADPESPDFRGLVADVVAGKVSVELADANEPGEPGTATVNGKAQAAEVRVHVAAGRAVRIEMADTAVALVPTAPASRVGDDTLAHQARGDAPGLNCAAPTLGGIKDT